MRAFIDGVGNSSALNNDSKILNGLKAVKRRPTAVDIARPAAQRRAMSITKPQVGS
jgi:hypothetical protein